MAVEPRREAHLAVLVHPSNVDIVEFDPSKLNLLFGLVIGSAAKYNNVRGKPVVRCQQCVNVRDEQYHSTSPVKFEQT